MTTRFNSPRVAAFDANGNPRSGARLYFYDPGTTTTKDVYSDAGLTTPISQPVLATSAGLWPTIFMEASIYRVICKDSSGVTIYDEDDFDPGLAAGFGVESVVGIAQGGTGANNAAAARANLQAASSSSLSTIQDIVTDHDIKITTGLNESDDSRFGLLAKEDAVTRDLLDAGFGRVCINRVRQTTVSNTTFTKTNPAYDTSTPLVSEGDIVFTYDYTPLSDDSEILIHVHMTGDGTTTIGITMGLFQDSTCIAADAFEMVGSGGPGSAELFTEVVNASTTQRTYSLRAGVTTGTFTINGSTGSLGGKRLSSMTIEEWVTA